MTEHRMLTGALYYSARDPEHDTPGRFTYRLTHPGGYDGRDVWDGNVYQVFDARHRCHWEHALSLDSYPTEASAVCALIEASASIYSTARDYLNRGVAMDRIILDVPTDTSVGDARLLTADEVQAIAARHAQFSEWRAITAANLHECGEGWDILRIDGYGSLEQLWTHYDELPQDADVMAYLVALQNEIVPRLLATIAALSPA